MNGGIEDAFTGNLIVKAYGLEGSMAAKNERLNDDLYRAGTKAAFLSYVVNPLVRMVNHLGYLCMKSSASMIGNLL